jgi:hypothetical protein
MFARREVFGVYGGFRTDLGPTGGLHGHTHEDSEWGFRIMTRGEKILYYPPAVVYHPVDEKRLSQEYLVRFFWNLGISYAKMEFSGLDFVQWVKTILSFGASLAARLTKYLSSLSQGQPAMTMHHKCLLYYQTSVLYHITVRKIFADGSAAA